MKQRLNPFFHALQSYPVGRTENKSADELYGIFLSLLYHYHDDLLWSCYIT